MKIVAILFLAVLTGPLALHAKTVSVSDQKFSITIPDDWTTMTQPGTLVAATDAQHKSSFAVISFANTHNDTVTDPKFVADMKEGMLNKVKSQGYSMNIVSEKAVSLDGVPAYYLQSTLVLPNNKTIYGSSYSFAANGQLYLLSVQSLDSTTVPGQQAIANSLHFDTPPTLPDPSLKKGSGERMGEFIGAALAVVIPLLFIARLFRRKPKA